MLSKIGQTVFFEEMPYITGYGSAVGKKEANGPLSGFFDVKCMDAYMSEKTYEKAEAKLQNIALSTAIKKAGITPEQVEYAFGGDLLNQCISSSYTLRDFKIPFLGLYGACSTMAEGIGLASVLTASGTAKHTAAVTSSHFCTAERQFRNPLNYGGQRAPTAQWTVTGSGALVISREGRPSAARIRSVTFGRVIDLGITDVNNMGAAMAPAAADTIFEFFRDSSASPEDFDLILTGDLGVLGSDILVRLLMDNGLDIKKQHNDCGKLIYDVERQDTHCGGSGCGCSASVLCSYILRKMECGELGRILFVATGALMSTLTVQQGESIPSVAHLIEICSGGR